MSEKILHSLCFLLKDSIYLSLEFVFIPTEKGYLPEIEDILLIETFPASMLDNIALEDDNPSVAKDGRRIDWMPQLQVYGLITALDPEDYVGEFSFIQAQLDLIVGAGRKILQRHLDSKPNKKDII